MQFPLRQSVFSLWSSTSALATPTVPTTGPVCWKPFWMILETMEEQRFWQGPEMREHQAVIPPGRCRCEERRTWSLQYLPMKAASASSSGNLTLISLRLVFRHHLGRDSGRFQKSLARPGSVTEKHRSSCITGNRVPTAQPRSCTLSLFRMRAAMWRKESGAFI